MRLTKSLILRRPRAHDRDEARLPPGPDREPERPLEERFPPDRRWPPEERRFEDDRPRPFVEERLRELVDERRDPDEERLRLRPDRLELLRPREEERL
jgi:hypothetical protein